MKRLFFIFILVMTVGGLFGLAIEETPGYVQIRYQRFLLETSFWFFFLMLVCSMLTLLGVWFAFRKIVMMRKQVAESRSLKAERMLLKKTDVAISAMIECRWEEATNLFTEVADASKSPLVFLLLAARSAHNLGWTDDRDNLLERAQSLSEESKRTASYLRAEFYIADGKHRDAVKLLTDIRAREELPEIWREELLKCYETLGEKRKAEVLVAELK